MLQRLEEATGHRFADLQRLDRALTHASARSKGGRDYERLEFLGDRVLGLCVAEMLFEQFQTANEGELSVRLNQLVNADALAEVADELSLSDFIRIGPT
jgi:ribonuclease-3